MRSSRIIALACVAMVYASGAVAQEPRVTYELVDPSNFTDFRIADEDVDHTSAVFDREFTKNIVPAAERILPAGEHLSIRILDMDMAGDIQPWRNNYYEPVRYVEFKYPPKMTVEYKLTDASGAVVAEGTQKIGDPGFDIRTRSAHRDDSFEFEMEMLRNWMTKLVAAQKG